MHTASPHLGSVIDWSPKTPLSPFRVWWSRNVTGRASTEVDEVRADPSWGPSRTRRSESHSGEEVPRLLGKEVAPLDMNQLGWRASLADHRYEIGIRSHHGIA